MSEARRLATFDDLMAVPEHLSAEIIDGELVVMPRPRSRHSSTTTRLLHRLSGPFGLDDDGPGGWTILVEPLIDLGPDTTQLFAPDLAGWRRETLPALTDEHPMTTVPDWVCEILSPATARLDRGPKADTYARTGVGWMWLVDGDLRTLEVWENTGGRWTRVGLWRDDAVGHVPPFEAIALPVGKLFPP